MMNEAPTKAIMLYYKARASENGEYADMGRYREEISFACLCMRCLWNKDANIKKPYHKMLGELYRDKDTGTVLKERIMDMLDEPWGQDGYLLTHLCSLTGKMRKRSGQIVPDFEELINQIANWNTQGIKRLWINSLINQTN